MDYLLNILTKALHKEKANLKFWEDIIKCPLQPLTNTHQGVIDDAYRLVQADGNIHSNQLRVEELEAAIVVINAHKKSSQQRNWQIVGSMIELTAEGQRVIDKANKPQKQQFKAAK